MNLTIIYSICYVRNVIKIKFVPYFFFFFLRKSLNLLRIIRLQLIFIKIEIGEMFQYNHYGRFYNTVHYAYIKILITLKNLNELFDFDSNM